VENLAAFWICEKVNIKYSVTKMLNFFKRAFLKGLHDFLFTPTSPHLHANRHGTVLERPIRPSVTFPKKGREADKMIVLALNLAREQAANSKLYNLPFVASI
jgi:hypothetical protein